MKWHDITLTIQEKTAVWPGQRPYERVVTAGREEGKSYLSRISMSTHFGTHIDAPRHFFQEGKSVIELDIDLLIGPCRVIEIEAETGLIGVGDLEGRGIAGEKRLLVKTCNSRIVSDGIFHEDFTAFSEAGAAWLLEKGVKLLGIDYFSIAPFQDTAPVHQLFLESDDTIALEGLDLSQITPGSYQLICLPMKIKGAGGAPARVLLGENS